MFGGYGIPPLPGNSKAPTTPTPATSQPGAVLSSDEAIKLFVDLFGGSLQELVERLDRKGYKIVKVS